MQSEERKVVAIDFDGTIAHYDGFKGKGVFGKPVDGVKDALAFIRKCGWVVMIYTTRLEVHQIKEYLGEHKIPYDYINYNPNNTKYMLHPAKMVANAYIDDRAVPFNGDWADVVHRLIPFKEWWREEKDEDVIL